MAEEDLSKIRSILRKHSDKSFVQRILSPGRYPTLQNEDGSSSTHSMAWGEEDGKFFVYPTVMLSSPDKLERFSDADAWKHARGSGNYIEFESAEEADWFSRHYKDIW